VEDRAKKDEKEAARVYRPTSSMYGPESGLAVLAVSALVTTFGRYREHTSFGTCHGLDMHRKGSRVGSRGRLMSKESICRVLQGSAPDRTVRQTDTSTARQTDRQATRQPDISTDTQTPRRTDGAPPGRETFWKEKDSGAGKRKTEELISAAM